MAVFTVLRSGKDDRYGFEVSWKHQILMFVFSLFVRLILLCEMAKKWPNTKHICIDVWRQTTHSGMHKPWRENIFKKRLTFVACAWQLKQMVMPKFNKKFKKSGKCMKFSGFIIFLYCEILFRKMIEQNNQQCIQEMN